MDGRKAAAMDVEVKYRKTYKMKEVTTGDGITSIVMENENLQRMVVTVKIDGGLPRVSVEKNNRSSCVVDSGVVVSSPEYNTGLSSIEDELKRTLNRVRILRENLGVS